MHPPGLHFLEAELTPGTTAPAGKPQDLSPTTPGAEETDVVRVPPSASTAPLPSPARLCDGDWTASCRGHPPHGWRWNAHLVPAATAQWSAAEPLHTCARPGSSPGASTPLQSPTGRRQEPATPLGRAWVLSPRRRSSLAPEAVRRGPGSRPPAPRPHPYSFHSGRVAPGSPRPLRTRRLGFFASAQVSPGQGLSRAAGFSMKKHDELRDPRS